ncbi:MAG: DUF6458 family protein [Actinomycetota bacterium]
MAIGTSLFLLAVGAILKFAVTLEFAGIDLEVVGVILMVVGGLGLLLSIFLMSQRRSTRVERDYNDGRPR